MNISAPLQTGTNRRNVWCLSFDITSNGDGSYRFINLTKDSLGFGSMVYVIDVPALVCYYDDNNTFIAGNKYPSVDHMIPIAKGGTHTWDNVQLAHRYCNSIKSDKFIENDKGQLRFF